MINFTLRYVVDYKKRRGTKDLLNTKILEASNDQTGRIKFAYSTLEISQGSDFKINIPK